MDQKYGGVTRPHEILCPCQAQSEPRDLDTGIGQQVLLDSIEVRVPRHEGWILRIAEEQIAHPWLPLYPLSQLLPVPHAERGYFAMVQGLQVRDLGYRQFRVRCDPYMTDTVALRVGELSSDFGH
jgi:hypothetical protein